MNSNHRARRLPTALAMAAAIVVATAAPAFAHVEVEAEPDTIGASNVVLTFQVPNEKPSAATTGITFRMPTDHPLVGVTAASQDGFTVSTTQRTLASPAAGPNGPVSQVVDTVTFSGGKITGHDEKAFVLHVDKLPDGVDTLTFKAIQNYSDGTSVAWIEVPADPTAEPDHPAPVLRLHVPAGVTPSPTAGAAPPAQASAETSRSWAVYVVGAGVVVAAGALVLRRRARRAT